MGLRVLVCGGRDYDDLGHVWSQLDAHHGMVGIACVLHGGATGADALAESWAVSNRVGRHRFPALWEKHGRAAGPIRNQRMLDEGKPDLVIAFPGGAGTADMVRRAIEAGVKVLDLRAVTPTPARTGDDR